MNGFVSDRPFRDKMFPECAPVILQTHRNNNTTAKKKQTNPKINGHVLVFVVLGRSHTDTLTVISTQPARYPLQVRQTFMIS